jgi:hypothetical protein
MKNFLRNIKKVEVELQNGESLKRAVNLVECHWGSCSKGKKVNGSLKTFKNT